MDGDRLNKKDDQVQSCLSSHNIGVKHEGMWV
jgi:hypothetical protein